MNEPTVSKQACARIPTEFGEFTLCLYHNSLDDKEHMALLAGEVDGREDVMVRVHSECFTGDVLGSLRCDCGPQLEAAMSLIAEEGTGVVLYMRQEGRGIGLLEKLRAYNLQDLGYDTVEANLMLGHQPDLRDYRLAALILKDLGVKSVRLLTNNPEKIIGLEEAGLPVSERLPLQTGVTAENETYLRTKVKRMRHLLDLGQQLDGTPDVRPLVTPETAAPPTDAPADAFADIVTVPAARNGLPFVTLTYAQSLDGSIAARRGEMTLISGPEAMALTHRIRAAHDAVLVGIGTLLSDDPQLTVRLVDGRNPQPVVVDSQLRFPLSARILRDGVTPWIATTAAADPGRQRELEQAGVEILCLPAGPDGRVRLDELLRELARKGIGSVMVEGGASIISGFLTQHLADRLVLTIAPRLLDGLNAVEGLRVNGSLFPYLPRPTYRALGEDVILFGELDWGE